MRVPPATSKPTLLLDFADALGRQSKTDNFLHNLLARHYDVQIVDDPEVLIFTHYGQRNRLYSCKKIFYTQERYFPDWKNCDAAVTSAFCDHPRAYYFPFFAAHRRGEDPIRPFGFDPKKISGKIAAFSPICINRKIERWWSGRGLSMPSTGGRRWMPSVRRRTTPV